MLPPPGTNAPLIVRVAGLPAEILAPFSHPGLIQGVVERARQQEELDQLRASLTDSLYQAIHSAAREERRFFLDIKRRCFNGENLSPQRMNPRWPLLAGVARTLADAIVAREEAIATLDAAFDESYHHALRLEREHISRLVENRGFMRGVALASPVAAQSSNRLKGSEAESYGRREKRLCLTLLRYASRAALKLSPFATLTRTAIARALEQDDGLAYVQGDSWRERSAVSLHRELLGQCACLLLRNRRFVEGLPVAVNETLSADDGGRFRFFRPGRWVFDETSEAFRYDDASFVRIKLEGSLVPRLLAELRDGPRICRDLLAGLQAELDTAGRETLAQALIDLLGAGFLNPVMPWDAGAPDLEQQILGDLARLPEGSELATFRRQLRELTGLLPDFAAASSPARFLEDSRCRAEGLFQALAVPAALPPHITFKAPDNTFEEDVFLLPGPERAGADEIVRLSRSRMQALLEDLDPLVRFANLHSRQPELLCALAALGDRVWPDAADVPFLEFFIHAQPLFEDYIRHRHSRQAAFNPLELASVAELVHWRQHVAGEIAHCFDEPDREQDERLCPRRLTALLDQVPAAFAGVREFCAFIQPADGAGRTWVVNTIGEGFGRFGGRFTAAMDQATRDRWTSYYTALSILERHGEEVELIDLSCPGGRTIDVHIPQTQRVLKLPGEGSHLPRERVLRLQDLRVRLHGAGRFPVLTSSAGRRLLPIQLGSSAARRRPTLLKFLAAFGPGELPQRLPVRSPRPVGGGEAIARHWSGSILYQRRRWVAELPPALCRNDSQDAEVCECWDLSNIWVCYNAD